MAFHNTIVAQLAIACTLCFTAWLVACGSDDSPSEQGDPTGTGGNTYMMGGASTNTGVARGGVSFGGTAVTALLAVVLRVARSRALVVAVRAASPSVRAVEINVAQWWASVVVARVAQ